MVFLGDVKMPVFEQWQSPTNPECTPGVAPAEGLTVYGSIGPAGGYGGSAYPQLTGDVGDRRLTIQWSPLLQFASHQSSPELYDHDVRVVLHEDGRIVMCYADTTTMEAAAQHGGRSRVGIRAPGHALMEYSCGEPNMPEGSHVMFTPKP